MNSKDKNKSGIPPVNGNEKHHGELVHQDFETGSRLCRNGAVECAEPMIVETNNPGVWLSHGALGTLLDGAYDAGASCGLAPDEPDRVFYELVRRGRLIAVVTDVVMAGSSDGRVNGNANGSWS